MSLPVNLLNTQNLAGWLICLQHI